MGIKYKLRLFSFERSTEASEKKHTHPNKSPRNLKTTPPIEIHIHLHQHLHTSTMVAPATQSPSTPTSSTFTTTKTSIHTAPDASSASVLHLPTVSTPQYVPASSVSASLDPLVVFSVLDHYQRRAPNHTRVIGALLGSRSEDGSDTIEIKNSFPLVHYEGDRVC